MKRVALGRAPSGVVDVRRKRTAKWVAYYEQGQGSKPADADWRKFAGPLATLFHGLCGYCERHCKGDVDHFRPKSRFPQLVYRWSNWVYSCPTCNSRHKGEKWPGCGFVNPCARRTAKPPGHYFRFDLLTAEIVPREHLTPAEFEMADTTIRELRLNDYSAHLKPRFDLLALAGEAVRLARRNKAELANLVHLLSASGREHGTLLRQFIDEKVTVPARQRHSPGA